MAKSCVAVLSFGVLTYQVRKPVPDESSPTGARMDLTTCTATMPDASSIPPQARKALADSRREEGLFGTVYFVRGEDAQTALPLPEAKAPKATK